MKTPLSRSKAMYFQYDISDKNNSAFVSLRSSTDTNYRLIGKLVTIYEYFQAPGFTLFPRYDDETQLLAMTAHTGSTALIVGPSVLEKSNSTQTLLLVSLFSSSIE